jgi:hypothetical protein
MPSSNLNVINLDFDAVKASLRDFLRSQSHFLDYNFEGSGLSILLDTLSYNTHFLAVYMSMLSSEMFLDSAVLRSSVVSLAKHLGYVPQSIRAARAVVSLVVTATDSASTMVLQRGALFNSKINGVNYKFVTDQAYTANLQNGFFNFPSVTLVEGIPYTYQTMVDFSVPNQKFILPSGAVDTSTLSVQVQTSVTNTTLTTFSLASNFLQVTADTKAYFIQETETGAFEVYFGDGVVGEAVDDGNLVVLDYLITHGPDANGANVFVPASSLSGYTTVATTTIIPASGGADAEDVSSIRFNAPKNFETQGRAVTAADYKLLIESQYKNADAVVVWGGETENPPQYGKVFISIKPVNGYVITEIEKQLVLGDIVSQRNVVSVIPEFVDPDYTYLVVNSTVKYVPANTVKSLGAIQQQAVQAIITFGQNELDQFNMAFKYSRLVAAIDASDTSISNNLTEIKLKKIFSPILNAPQTYTFSLNAQLRPGTLFTSSFVTVTDPLLQVPYVAGNTYHIIDDGAGSLIMIQSALGTPDRMVRVCGTINYSTGEVSLSEIVPSQADVNGNLTMTVESLDNNVSPVRNNILYIDPTDITVNVLPIAQ